MPGPVKEAAEGDRLPVNAGHVDIRGQQIIAVWIVRHGQQPVKVRDFDPVLRLLRRALSQGYAAGRQKKQEHKQQG